ncbi:MAG: SCO family protein [Leptospira sp.]|nr:SCO family protein [Leptospira sp.]
MRLFYLHLALSLMCFTMNCHYLGDASRDKSEISHLKFTLPNGNLLSPEFWNKGYTVLYFGFSHCPDMCPLALTNFGRASLILGPLGNQVRFVFVTLDTERDNPTLLENYSKQFPGGKLVALSPTNESILRLGEIFGLINKKVNFGNSYTVEHSNFIYILDENINQIAALPGGTSANVISEQLRKIIIKN